MKEKKKKKIKEKRTLLPGAIALGLVLAVIVYAVMLNAEKNALKDFEKEAVWIAAKKVPAGQMITEDNYQEFFERKDVDKRIVSSAAILSLESLEGLAACYTIDAGTLLTKGMFEDINEITKDMEEPVIAGFKADDLYQVVGGVLRAGDRIHIYSVSEENETSLIWDDVYVQGVFDQAGTQIGNEDAVTAAQRINVYMDKADVEVFYSELASGTLRVVKAYK